MSGTTTPSFSFGTNFDINLTKPSSPVDLTTPYYPNLATPTTNTNTTSLPLTPPHSTLPPETTIPSSTGSATQTPISDAQATTILNGILNGSGTNPNVLDQWQQTAYHFRFFCATDGDIYAAAGSPANALNFYNSIIPAINQPIASPTSSPSNSNITTVVIAETGSTIYNISSVEIDTVVGPTYETRNVLVSKIQMKIIEPLGGSFLNALKAAADNCTVKNFKTACYYIELSFKAYDTSGNIVENPLLSQVSGIPSLNLTTGNRWIWQISIVDIDINIDAAGGSYTLSCIPYEATSLYPEISQFPEIISVSGKTIGEYFDNLGVAMTKNWLDRYGFQSVKYGDPANNIPAFKFFPIPAGLQYAGISPSTFSLIDKNPNLNKQRSKDTSTANGDILGQIQPGTTIQQIVDSALAATEQGQDLGLDRNSVTGQTDASTTQTNSKLFRETVTFRVVPDVIISGYDFYSGRYIVTVSYYVFPFYSQYPITSQLQVSNAMNNPTVSNSAMKAIIKRGLMKKKYNYLYTGLNTEILNLDLSLNSKWLVSLPKVEGARQAQEAIEANKILNKNVTTGQGGKQSVVIKGANTPLPSTPVTSNTSTLTPQQDLNILGPKIQSSRQQVSVLTGLIEAIPPSQTQAQVNTAIANNQTDLTRSGITLGTYVTYQNLQSARSSITQTSSLYDKSYNAISTQQVISETSTTAGTTLTADSLVVNSGGAPNPSSYFPYQVTFEQNYTKAVDQTGNGFIGQYHRDMPMLGAVLNQLYDGNVSAATANPLMSIEMTIRGDPYWIGETNLARQIYLRNPAGEIPSLLTDQPTWLNGETCMVLEFNLPYQQSSTTYAPNLTNDIMFQGVYIVYKVINVFEEGYFKQVLSAKRIPLISLLAAKSTNTTTASTASTTTSAPNAADNAATTANSSLTLHRSPPPITTNTTNVYPQDDGTA